MKSFAEYYNQKGTRSPGQQGNGNAPAAGRKATDAQLKHYYELCNTKELTPVDVKGKAFDEMDQLIKHTRTLRSVGQKYLIEKKVNDLDALGKKVNIPDVDTLTGGEAGTASALIRALITQEQELQHQAPVTEGQLDFLMDMFLCPDVDFESYEVERRIELDEINEHTGTNFWRYFTPEEFEGQLKEKLNKKSASELIEKNKAEFYKWQSSRAKIRQREHIRELEARLADMSVPKEVIPTVEWVIDDNGDMQMVEGTVEQHTKDYAPKGYEGLDDMQLLMMSVQDASAYIDMLKSELSRKELYGPQDGELEPEEDRSGAENYLDGVKDLLHKVEAIVGYESEEKDLVDDLVVQGVDSESLQETRRKIKGFIMALVEYGDLSIGEVIELCRDSETAQRILIGAV